ncbi:transcriptional regulator BetI [Sphingomonas sp. 1P06PA]|uniref:transcriptional regulator BetI n=1 Tax=Sphingomonas sp. 1P06PA TaxID=554121 RepID=UPI0039A5D94C
MTRAFTRAPDARRQALIDATRAVLARAGAQGVSVRTVCAEAGVSPGLLRHYFAGIDALVEATYDQVADIVQASLETAMAAAGADPRARLAAYVTASFAPAIADGALLATWLGFWSLAKSSPEMAAIHARSYARYRAVIEDLVHAAAPAADARLAAIGIGAVVDGLWLELSLDPTSFTPAEAGAIAERAMAAMLSPS